MNKFKSIYENEFLPGLDILDEGNSNSVETFKAYDRAKKALDKMGAVAFAYAQQQQLKIFHAALNESMMTYQQVNGIEFIY